MNKKAQGISINTIIIAAIALVVLVVVIAIFSGFFGGKFGPALDNVGSKCTAFKQDVDGTTYNADWKSDCGENEKEIFTANDASDNPGMHCCVINK